MIVTDQIKYIDNKIKANQAQYHLDRLAAKISALSSGEFRKYEVNQVVQKVNQVKKTSISGNELERSAYYPDVANMEGIDILGSKNETQTSYLKDDLEAFFLGYPDIFD